MPASFTFEAGGRVVCERGVLEWRLRLPAGAVPTMRVVRYGLSGEPEISEALERNPYEVECRRFVDVIRGRADPALLGGEAALEGLRIVDAARRSLREGRAVAP